MSAALVLHVGYSEHHNKKNNSLEPRKKVTTTYSFEFRLIQVWLYYNSWRKCLNKLPAQKGKILTQSKEGDGCLTNFFPPLRWIRLFGAGMLGYGITVRGLVYLYTNLLSSSIKFKSPVGRPQIKSKQAKLSTNSTFLHSIPSETYSSWKLQKLWVLRWIIKHKMKFKIRNDKPFHNFILTFDQSQIAKIHWHYWKERLNPLSPNTQIQILQTNLHTFPLGIGWENLFADQSFCHQVIISLILTTFSLHFVLILR